MTSVRKHGSTFATPASRAWQRVTIALCALVCALISTRDAALADPPPASAPAAQPAPTTQASQPTTQEATPPQPGVSSPESIRAAIQRVETSSDYDDATKQRIIAFLNETLANLRLIEQLRGDRTKFQGQADGAPEQLAAGRTELENLGAESPLAVSEEEPLAQLEQRLQQEEAALLTARRDSEGADERVRTRALRRLELPRLQADAEAQLQELLKAIASNSPPENNPAIAAARREMRLSAKGMLEEQAATLAAEQRAVEAADELLAVQSEVARTRRVQREARVEVLRDTITRRRKAEAEAARLRAEAEAADAIGAHPAVKAIADEVVALAAKRQHVVAKTEATEKRRTAIEAKLPELEPRLREARETVQNFGLTPAIGYLLRKQQRELDSTIALRRELATTEREIADAHFETTLLAEQRSALADLDQALADTLASITPPPRASERAWLERGLREKLSAKRDALADALRDYSASISASGRLYTQEKKLLDVTQKFSEFIDEHVLWVRSEPPLTARDLPAAWQTLSFFTDAQEWRRLGDRLERDVRRSPIETAGILIALLLAFLLRRRLKRSITRIGESLLRERVTSFYPTLETLFVTVLASLFWPALLVFASMWLTNTVDATTFEKSLAAALRRVAAMVVVTELYRLICMRNGLGEAHFGWARDTMWRFRRDLGVVLALGIPLAVISGSLAEGGSDSARASLGRLAFMAGVAVLSLLMHHLVYPRSGAFAVMLALRPGGLFDRLRYVIYVAGMGSLVGLIVLAITGYQYSALRIAWCVQETVWLLLALATVYSLILRWLILAHRRLAQKQADERAAAAAAGEMDEAAVPPDDANLSTISHQTQRLVRSLGAVALLLGMWGIWGDVLPALELLRRVALWNTVTLADFLVAAGVALITVIASKNIPGLLEILILRNLPFDNGVRYAYTTITRYVIFVVGMVVAFDFLGVNWGSVQWLVAAMTVGLGFGLQEIFANFVSGIIILFERPIRVGDVITVGDHSGLVTQIRTRATTIRGGDNKELIVPNKELVTGQIVNWTLSDQTVRLLVSVGVAYGSDTRRVRNLLLRIAKENPRIVADPEPMALFLSFGDSTLNFELRVFVASPLDLPVVQHQLNTAINDAFAEEGIEIAFPQREVRLRLDGAAGDGAEGESPNAAAELLRAAGGGPASTPAERAKPAGAPERSQRKSEPAGR